MSDDAIELRADPSYEALARAKAEFPTRRCKRVCIDHDGDEVPFIMTSPVREEWKKYRREMTEAAGDVEKLEGAIERAALAMIRWPSRDECRAIFDSRPGIVQVFADELAKMAGAQAEVSAKNG